MSERAIPPRVPGYPGQRLPPALPEDEGPLQRAARSINAIDQRLDLVERRLESVEHHVNDISQMKSDMAEIKLGLAAFKSVLNGAASKAMLLIVGAIGATYGVGRVTETKQEPTTTIIQRSAFDRALDACRALQSSDAQGECIGRVIREQMPVH